MAWAYNASGVRSSHFHNPSLCQTSRRIRRRDLARSFAAWIALDTPLKFESGSGSGSPAKRGLKKGVAKPLCWTANGIKRIGSRGLLVFRNLEKGCGCILESSEFLNRPPRRKLRHHCLIPDLALSVKVRMARKRLVGRVQTLHTISLLLHRASLIFFQFWQPN